MNTYAFILGRKHLLSVAELCNVLPADVKIIDIVPEALIAGFPHPIADFKARLGRLGGTVKIAEIFAQVPKKKDAVATESSRYLQENFADKAGKLIYGVSLYSFKDKNEPILRKTLTTIKKELTKSGLKSRFINHNFKNLENAAIKGEKLLEEGAEIAAIEGNNELFIGKTRAIQDFESYSHRDYDRPERAPRLGMLPPKLAQIMINLGGFIRFNETTHPNLTVYDPFTGIGTVLTEGLIMGYNVVGSDINKEVLEKAKKNITWTQSQFPETKKNVRIFKKDATQLSKKDLPEKIDLVVTESYLGPPVSIFPTPEHLQLTFRNIEKIIIGFFNTAKSWLKPGTPVIICFPIYRRQDRMFFMENIDNKIKKLGFESQPLIPKEIISQFNLKTFQRQSLIYDRPDQIIGREIWKFVKK